MLDDGEVASTTYFCNGTTAAVGTTLLTADEPAGDNCPDGGTSITTGIDTDGDGALTGDEITDVRYVCAASAAGGDALTVATDEPAGDNCPNGGMRLDAGTDDDGSGALDEGEITATSYACYPADEGTGDDRGSVVLSESYVFYNGDGGLVRTDRALDGLERVVEGPVDTLLSDASSFELYSLWTADFDFADLDEARSSLRDTSRPWTRIVTVDEDTLAVGDAIDLERPFDLTRTTTLTLDDVETRFRAYYALIGMDAGRIVTAMRGYDETLEQSRILYIVYDAADGAILSSWSITDDDPAYRDYDWWQQEVSLGHNPVRFDGEAEHLLYRSSGGWHEVNVRTGEVVRVSQTFALDCDTYHPAIDFASLTLVAHSEGRCFDEASRAETLYTCDLLLAPNDEGGVDDSGVNNRSRD